MNDQLTTTPESSADVDAKALMLAVLSSRDAISEELRKNRPSDAWNALNLGFFGAIGASLWFGVLALILYTLGLLNWGGPG